MDWSVEWSVALQFALQSNFLSGVLFGVRQSALQKFWSAEKWIALQILVADWSMDCTGVPKALLEMNYFMGGIEQGKKGHFS